MGSAFSPGLALAGGIIAAVCLGLGWLTGRYAGLLRAGLTVGAAEVIIGLAAGRLPLAAGGVVILAAWLVFAAGRRRSR